MGAILLESEASPGGALCVSACEWVSVGALRFWIHRNCGAPARARPLPCCQLQEGPSGTNQHCCLLHVPHPLS